MCSARETRKGDGTVSGCVEDIVSFFSFPFAACSLLYLLFDFAVPLPLACPVHSLVSASSFSFALASTGLNARFLLSLLCFTSVLVTVFRTQEIQTKKIKPSLNIHSP
jgi:hypothetical protein